MVPGTTFGSNSCSNANAPIRKIGRSNLTLSGLPKASPASDTVTQALNGVSAKLTTQTLIDLLTKGTVDKQDPNAVAKEWLTSQGLS